MHLGTNRALVSLTCRLAEFLVILPVPLLRKTIAVYLANESELVFVLSENLSKELGDFIICTWCAAQRVPRYC